MPFLTFRKQNHFRYRPPKTPQHDLALIKVEKPIEFSKNSSTEKITRELNIWLEKIILKNPGEWIWSHDRWK